MNEIEGRALLVKNGWTEITPENVRSAWRWVQPKTHARFQFQDAVEYEQAMARVVHIAKRAAPSRPTQEA
jgi:hypothetical protein